MLGTENKRKINADKKMPSGAKKESIAPRAARYMIKSRNYEMDWTQLIQSEKMKIYHNFYN